jgi:hypothetical protein
MKLTGLFLLACTLLHSQEAPAGRVYSAKPLPPPSPKSKPLPPPRGKTAERVPPPQKAEAEQRPPAPAPSTVDGSDGPSPAPAAPVDRAKLDQGQARRIARFMPKNIKRSFPDIEATRVPDVDPLLRELAADLPGPVRDHQFGRQEKSYWQNFSTIVREEDGNIYRRMLDMRLRVLPDFREAEKSFAEFLSLISIYIHDESLSRNRFGEASYDPGGGTLIFIRRNVLVILYHHGSVTDASGKRKTWNDPGLRLATENLARRIDDLILVNPR